MQATADFLACTQPLNPILGELFLGNWEDKDGQGETTLVAEQGEWSSRLDVVPLLCR